VTIVTLTFNKKSQQALAVVTPQGYSSPTPIERRSWEENVPMPEVDALKAPLSDSTSKEIAQATSDSKENRGIERRRRHHRRHHRRRW
jgi:hypothetical protein